uniref:Uncharacterized protein n=1 Tax=Ascaris lumbricoides TaxID=6252 RepID=A0A0M3HGI1_ASCLU
MCYLVFVWVAVEFRRYYAFDAIECLVKFSYHLLILGA